jgi:metal-sulfur cluster biosynthetic enzyme
VDIYEIGLVYDITADADRRVLVKMTLTSPARPSAQQIPSEARYKIRPCPVTDAWVDIVWEPPWDKERMSEAAKLQLGFF